MCECVCERACLRERARLFVRACARSRFCLCARARVRDLGKGYQGGRRTAKAQEH